MTLPGDRIATAYLESCLAELEALKPGNVHVFAPGHAMTVADFAASARASASVMGEPSISVGARVLGAIRQTRAVVDCNTNLGIVLLCAPLAQAAMSSCGGGLLDRLRLVLDGLDVADADQTFEAIRLARPGGLGSASEHDVRKPATVSLRAAMESGRDRDRIALQYSDGFADVFQLGVPRLREALVRRWTKPWAISVAYLAFLSAFPDSHVMRRHGGETALELCRSARRMAERLEGVANPTTLMPEFLAYDAELKGAGINPGTSADLTVASLFAMRLQDAEMDLADPGSM